MLFPNKVFMVVIGTTKNDGVFNESRKVFITSENTADEIEKYYSNKDGSG